MSLKSDLSLMGIGIVGLFFTFLLWLCIFPAILWVCWNYGICDLHKSIPEISFFQSCIICFVLWFLNRGTSSSD